jgi:hypothetical protein
VVSHVTSVSEPETYARDRVCASPLPASFRGYAACLPVLYRSVLPLPRARPPGSVPAPPRFAHPLARAGLPPPSVPPRLAATGVASGDRMSRAAGVGARGH